MLDLPLVYPGETVEVLVGQRKNAWLWKVVNPTLGRREPVCGHFGSCGGCSLLNLDYPQQLQLKWSPVRQALAMAAPEAHLLAPVPSPQQLHYRTKLEFTFCPSFRPREEHRVPAQDAERAEVGFHWSGKFDRVVDVKRCYLARGPQVELLAHTRQWAKDWQLQAWHPRQHRGHLRYLVYRHAASPPNLDPSSGHWLASLVTSPEVSRQALEDWTERLRPYQPAGLWWATQTSLSPAVFPDAQFLLWGREKIVEQLGQLRFEVGWRSFYQANPNSYLLLLNTVVEWVSHPQHILDLYCGVGSIGLYLQSHFVQAKLCGVEEVAPAVEDARQAAVANGRVAQFYCSPAQDWEDLQTDLLVLDPPRSGCHPKMVEKVSERGPSQLIYISCNPQAFLREWSTLKQNYRLVKAQAFDFFPQTRHLELLAYLVRRDEHGL